MSGVQFQRLEDRHEVHLPACITTEDGRLVVATMCDVSRSGGRFRINRQLEVGREVRVRLTNKVERTGVIRRCVQSEMGSKFEVGLELIGACWPDELLPREE